MEAQKGPGTVGGAAAKGGFTEPPLGPVLMVRGVPVGLLCCAEPWSVVVLLLRSIGISTQPAVMMDSSMSDAQLLRWGGHSARSLGSGCMADPSVLQSRGAHVRSDQCCFFSFLFFSTFIMEDKLVLFHMLSALLVWLPSWPSSLASDSAADSSSTRRREEIRLGKRPVDSIIGASFVNPIGVWTGLLLPVIFPSRPLEAWFCLLTIRGSWCAGRFS
uniref:Uncharacterized protein n=1 Tax=Aegilops tauschii subsp. strangulata TaxID=200361 RepID=A0A453R068_AEGTS